MTDGYDRIKALLSKVIAGDEEAERELNLCPLTIAPEKPKITPMELKLAQQQNLEIAAAAKALNFPLLEACAKANIAYASLIYASVTERQLNPEVIEPQDYCQTILATLKEIEDSIGMKKVWGSGGKLDDGRAPESGNDV